MYVCVLKCNYFCSSWCTIHQLPRPPFSFGNFSRLLFLTVFVLLLYCIVLLKKNLFRSILSIHSLSFLSSLVWYCFSAFSLRSLFSLSPSVAIFLFLFRCVCIHVCFLNFSYAEKNPTDGKSLRLAFNNWVGNFQLLIFIVLLSSSFAHMCCSIVSMNGGYTEKQRFC